MSRVSLRVFLSTVLVLVAFTQPLLMLAAHDGHAETHRGEGRRRLPVEFYGR